MRHSHGRLAASAGCAGAPSFCCSARAARRAAAEGPQGRRKRRPPQDRHGGGSRFVAAATIRRLVPVAAGNLASAIQDAAAAPYAGGAVLLGGLTPADVSSDEIVTATRAGSQRVGRIPTALHDSAAVTIGRSAYLFGGGTGVDAARHDPDGRPAHRRRAGGRPPAGRQLGPVRGGHRPDGVHRRRLHGQRAGSTRSSPGAPAGARASSRTFRTRCATPR